MSLFDTSAICSCGQPADVRFLGRWWCISCDDVNLVASGSCERSTDSDSLAMLPFEPVACGAMRFADPVGAVGGGHL